MLEEGRCNLLLYGVGLKGQHNKQRNSTKYLSDETHRFPRLEDRWRVGKLILMLMLKTVRIFLDVHAQTPHNAIRLLDHVIELKLSATPSYRQNMLQRKW